MQLQFWSIGKKNEAYVAEGVALFTKRISHYYKVEWKIIATTKNSAVLSAEDLKIEEGKIILNNLQKDDYLILLDERGKNLQSEELAKVLQKRNNDSTKQVIFLGDVFDNKQIEGLEDHRPTYNSQVDWELDDYTLKRLEELGLGESKPPEDGSEFISRL